MVAGNQLFQPHLPEVDIRTDIDHICDRARAAADESTVDANGLYHRQVIIVTPGRLLIGKDCPLPGDYPGGELDKLINLLPVNPPPQHRSDRLHLSRSAETGLAQGYPFFWLPHGIRNLRS